jgi:putative molybdopterin biosynthesis protein
MPSVQPATPAPKFISSKTDMSAIIRHSVDNELAYMSVKQVADYLHLNEKKIYALLSEDRIPATKITGKWMFPRELIDKWMHDSSHGGLLTDQLIVSGSDDPLLYRVVLDYAADTGAYALISYSPTATQLGLNLLESRRVDVCGIHWGPDSESHIRHPALLKQHSEAKNWVLIHAFRREQGLMLKPNSDVSKQSIEEIFHSPLRWTLRQPGAGAQRFLMEQLCRFNLSADDLICATTALSEREAAASIAMGMADIAPGVRAAATEYGLDFISFGWESFDLAIPRTIWFRRLFQELINRLKSPACQQQADRLTGYDLSKTGALIWGQD